jgi:DNA-directed RNA polymerase subunit H (RpoH/RPB5)
MNDNLFTNLNDFKYCIKTLTETDGLLDRRNYRIHEKYHNIDIKNINLQNSYYMIAKHNEKKKKFIFIYFINTTGFLSKTYKSKNINILDCEKYIKELYNVNDIIIDIIIIFTKNIKINNLIEKKIIERININNIQTFSYKNLLFNVSKHKYIPKYIRIISDKKEIDLICKIKNIDNVLKLPKIHIIDPLSNFYGIKIGELFEFKRKNHNSGEYIYYRLCIN